jgi:cytosine/adenosine deaminase-related metal-dependent hydrolase
MDLVVENVTVLMMDPERRVIPGATVSVRDDRIVSVVEGPPDPSSRPAKRIDGTGKVLMPGFVNAHAHAIHNLLRGGLSDDRTLYDWLLNVLYPGVLAYTAEDAKLAARLFCIEAIRSGITTVVDNADFGRRDELADATIGTYDEMGMRAIYARMFSDTTPAELLPYIETIEAKEPGVRHDPDPIEQTTAALESIERLIQRHHGRADGRIQVWPSPGIAVFTSQEGLLGAKDLAKRNGTMLTIHVAESKFDAQQLGVSSVEYLATIGFLGPDVLAGHCVQLDDNDIRILRVLDVKVANNVVSNMFLASGIAPVAQLQLAGVTVGIGTDDCNCNTSVNMLSDMKFVALAQKVKYLSSAAITAERVVEMATIDGARAVGMADAIGSIEPGKKADFILVDLRHPQAVPCFSIPSVLVYQTYGNEVDTVVVDGQILMEGRRLTRVSEEEEAELLTAVQAAAEDVVVRAGMARIRDRGWRSFVAI